MNAFYNHHKDSIRFGYRCFDRILLNGLIQPFQQPERVIGFFGSYRQVYPVSREVLRGAAEQFQRWVGTCRSPSAGSCSTTSMSTTQAGAGCSYACALICRFPPGSVSISITG